MAKRANPYIEDYVQQSKVHVGIKQFNNNEERLKKVYEKTLKLLFKGAKKSHSQDETSAPDLASHDRKDKMKQLFLGKDGTLLQSGTLVQDRKVTDQQCICGSPTAESRCGYCEVKLCSVCQQHCVRCERPYCTRCSLIGSEGAEVCVSCYG